MITTRGRGECIRRKPPITIKKVGKGTLYITTYRIVFESKGYGDVLTCTSSAVQMAPCCQAQVPAVLIRAGSEHKGRAADLQDVRLQGGPREARGQGESDPIDSHCSLWFAYAEWVDNGQM